MIEKGTSLQEAAVLAMGTLSILPQAPKSEAEVKQVALLWVAMFERNGLSGDDLAAAVPECLDTEKFFPKAPAVLLDCARRAIEKKRRDRHIESLAATVGMGALPLKGVPLADRPDRERMEELRADARRRLRLDNEGPPVAKEKPDRQPSLTQRIDQLRSDIESRNSKASA